MALHRLREELRESRARLFDRADFIERRAIDLFPPAQRRFDELREPGEVPVEAPLGDAKGAGEARDGEGAEAVRGDGGERRVLPIRLLDLDHTGRYGLYSI